MSLKQQIVDDKTGEVKSERKLPDNHGFLMMFDVGSELMEEIIDEYPKAAAMLTRMTRMMDGTNTLIASRETLGSLLNMSRGTVGRCIRYLKEKKAITTSTIGNITAIHVNSRIAWKNGLAKAKYAKFNATVIISEKEQKYDAEITTTRSKIVGKIKP
ncbi:MULTISPECIES: helix-turn-helix domain-containing protein [Burkholderia]|uniref:Winged helix-turn-helix domain-containing protein n=1 Tax=Burkholderia cenocepacia TaxID=95486 RepID=A0ABD4UCK9_9BURK|nr:MULTISPECIES: helix-turn-helix domain-containing protein [Burkholderia]MCW3498629.1 winged helix-turn-helix domain-containing protein [Burkholderia cenocepacia]MCW3506283.1 winged helix-turn-helix domain-containing protein [Burkholderia cenocepacia]MCW3513782.1 winged helix-turn-helix domain-containing protein [Burkholderia cenocepacia]MCW3528932.1 winged helix-turn-helix domain-containing protein [Burkholderia cenocepacia]MCW3544734.1 winged helix-turn-helix domain-containing protein [Burk